MVVERSGSQLDITFEDQDSCSCTAFKVQFVCFSKNCLVASFYSSVGVRICCKYVFLTDIYCSNNEIIVEKSQIRTVFFVKWKVVQVELICSENQNAMIMTIVVGFSFDLVAVTVLVASLHRNITSTFAADSENIEITEVVDAV